MVDLSQDEPKETYASEASKPQSNKQAEANQSEKSKMKNVLC